MSIASDHLIKAKTSCCEFKLYNFYNYDRTVHMIYKEYDQESVDMMCIKCTQGYLKVMKYCTDRLKFSSKYNQHCHRCGTCHLPSHKNICMICGKCCYKKNNECSRCHVEDVASCPTVL